VETLARDAAVATRPRLDSLTGLRFFAAFVVFSFHLESLFYFFTPLSVLTHAFGQGPTGVSFFFILSGFVLTWSHKQDDTSGAFYQRRLAKIGPLQVVTWGIMGVLVLSFSLPTGGGPAVAQLFLLTPWIPQYTYHLTMNNPSWSLGCELFFYALFPLMLPQLRRWTTVQRRWAIVGLVFLAFCFAAAASPAHPYTTSYWALYFFPPVRLVEFVLGMLLAMEVADGRLRRIPLVAAAAFTLIVYIADSWAPASLAPVALTIIPFSLLIVAAAQVDIARTTSWLRKSAVVKLGTWSFALYMVHWPVLILFAHSLHGRLGDWQTAALGVSALAASIAASALLYKLVEHPLEVLLRPRKNRVPAEATLATGEL
jgi:peptidoglycan/LPS O-acetylase OafA/YrhL